MESLVSVIIPVYNREHTLRRAICSVLGQTYKDIEIIVVDDASTDGSAQIAQEYIENGVQIIALSQNVGVAEARNVGMRAAKGKYIAFQDSDDEWLPDKLNIQIGHMERENFKVSTCPYILTYNEGLTQLYPSEDKIQMVREKGLREFLHKENIAGTTPTLVMHREVMETVGFFDRTFQSFEDYDYWIRISEKYDIGFIEQPLLKVHRTKVSLTTDKEVYISGREQMLAKHSDFLDLEYRIKGVAMFHTYDYADGFLPGLERMRELYTKGDAEKRQYLDDVLLKSLGQEYIMMKRVQRYDRESRILQLQGQIFAIYGAGYIGKNVYYRLKKKSIVPKMFIVSHLKDGEMHDIDGVPVRELCEVEDKKMEIIVAVALETQEEILKNLRKEGFQNYFILDELEGMY